MSDTATPAPAEEDGSPQPPPAVDPEATEPEPTEPKAGAETPDADDKADKTPEDKRTVEQIAADYIIPLSDIAKAAWESRPQDYLPYAIETAKGLYPTLAPQLAKGMTTKILVDPYVQIAQQLLGATAKPDWNDPKWEKALDGDRDPKTGMPMPMSLSEWRNLLRTDPAYGYDRTAQSHASADTLASTIHDAFSGKLQLPPSAQGTGAPS